MATRHGAPVCTALTAGLADHGMIDWHEQLWSLLHCLTADCELMMDLYQKGYEIADHTLRLGPTCRCHPASAPHLHPTAECCVTDAMQVGLVACAAAAAEGTAAGMQWKLRLPPRHMHR